MVSLRVHDQQLKTKTERKLGDFSITIPILWNITSSQQSRYPLLIWASWPWPLTPLTEIDRFPDLNIKNFCLKFESDLDFYDLSAWDGCWFDVYIRRFIYKFLNVCPFDYTAVAGSGKVWPVNQVYHTSWVAVVTQTDRNRCLIALFCGVVCVFTLPFWHFRGCRGFCHRTESDLLLFVFAKTVVFIMTTRESMMDIQTHSPNHTRTVALLYLVQCYFKGIIIFMREITFVPRHFTFSTLQGRQFSLRSLHWRQ